MTRSGMTTRRWMIAVAVVALVLAGGLWSGRMLRLRRQYLRESAMHEALLQAIAKEGALAQQKVRPTMPGPDWEEEWSRFVAGSRPFIAYHTHLKGKYRLAASRPWSTLE